MDIQTLSAIAQLNETIALLSDRVTYLEKTVRKELDEPRTLQVGDHVKVSDESKYFFGKIVGFNDEFVQVRDRNEVFNCSWDAIEFVKKINLKRS